MTRKFWVTRDQAVWERERYCADVPDNVKDEDVDEYLREQLDAGALGEPEIEILCNAVDGISTEVDTEEIK